MISGLCILALLWSYLTAYVVSLYASAVYIDPDDVARLLPELSKRRRRRLARLVQDPRAFFHVAVIYRYLAFIIVVVATLVLSEQVISQGVVYLKVGGLLAAWVLFILVAEFLPRRGSLRPVPQRIIGWLWLISLLYGLLGPVVLMFRSWLERSSSDRPVTEQEKEEIVERAIETLAEQAGIGETIVEEDERQMIGQIFQLDQTQVREIMSPRIDLVGIEKSTRFVEIQNLIRRDGYSRYPVYEGTIDKIIGVLYVKDLFTNQPPPGEEFVITDYLRQPYFVPETKVIGELLREFRTRKFHVAIVIDDYGGVSGLVTLEDILEEIVGEIRDEHDDEEDDIVEQTDGTYVVDAGLRLDRLQELLSTSFRQDENATVGGLLYDLVGSVPEVGREVDWNGVRLTVLQLDGQRIVTVKVDARTVPGRP